LVLITLIFLSYWGHKLLTDFRGMSQSIQTNVPMAHFGAKAPQCATAISFTKFLDHTQRRTTVGRTPLDEWSARRRDLYL